MGADEEEEHLLETRAALTAEVEKSPYDCIPYLKRAECHEKLGYPDLSAFDAYKAFLLLDEVADDSGEYHQLALAALLQHVDGPDSPTDREVQDACARLRCQAVLLISRNLLTIGCLRSAYTFVKQYLSTVNDDELQSPLKDIECFIRGTGKTEQSDGNNADKDIQLLPDKGCVRREVYPWNFVQSNRTSESTVEQLNEGLSAIAPKLEVRVVELPLLSAGSEALVEHQLGLFAKEDIATGEEILRERTLLTANARHLEPLCDACGSLLPSLESLWPALSEQDDRNGPVQCDDCDDTVFCSQTCHDLAHASYHPSICGTDVDAIAEDVPPQKAADALYTLLLQRALAMSLTQDKHALDLEELRNICGEFTPISEKSTNNCQGEALFKSMPLTLPFSFEDNVLLPLHMLEKMEVDIFASPNGIAELWVWNTIYAKLRATASARLSTRDGRPEVAAVHPFWCLANHSCDPNVQWEWAGEIQFTAREQRVTWKRRSGNETGESLLAKPGGIRAGEEILNHYVDIDLDVSGRREWGVGALGGHCRCERCVWEANE